MSRKVGEVAWLPAAVMALRWPRDTMMWARIHTAPLSVPAGGAIGGAAGGIIGGTAGAVGYTDRYLESQTGGGQAGARPVTNEITIDNQPRYEIRIDGLDRDEIRRAVEDAQRDNLRELENRLDDVERRLDRMKRSFENGP